MNKFIHTSAALILLMLSTGCSDQVNRSPMPSISEEARGSLHKKVNCKTAEQDIQVLEGERASVQRQALAGVRTVFPLSAVVGMLTGDYSDRTQVATGQYNRDINAKIGEIRDTCGVG